MSPPLKGGGGSTQLGVVGGRAGDTIGDSESRFTHRVRLSRLTRLARQIMMMKGNPRAMRCTSSSRLYAGRHPMFFIQSHPVSFRDWATCASLLPSAPFKTMSARSYTTLGRCLRGGIHLW
jgi:hypothetical protein